MLYTDDFRFANVHKDSKLARRMQHDYKTPVDDPPLTHIHIDAFRTNIPEWRGTRRRSPDIRTGTVFKPQLITGCQDKPAPDSNPGSCSRTRGILAVFALAAVAADDIPYGAKLNAVYPD
ncbi:unnamed protein product, partial [Notodromas monacha]